MAEWRRSLLKRIGAPVTPGNLRLLSNWQRWEGGHTKNNARYNWLNTTHGPGSPINSVGVKRFADFDTGIQSLAETLQNGRYEDVLKGLRSGKPFKHDLTAGLSTWVSGSPDGNLEYARKVTGRSATPKAAPPVKGGRGSKGNPDPVADPPSSPTQDLMKIAFEDDPEFLDMIGKMNAMRPRDPNPKVSRMGDTKPVQPKGVYADVIAAAQTQLGKPYVFGSGPNTDSFDCSDLVQWAYKQQGINIPRTTYEQMKVLPKKSWKNLQPGDLLYKNDGGHVVMYVGNGKVIAAPYTGTVVQHQPLSRFQSGGNYHVRYVPR